MARGEGEGGRQCIALL